MKKAIIILSAIALFSLNGYAESIDARELRKIVMKSDVIFASNHYKTISNYANDYSAFGSENSIKAMVADKGIEIEVRYSDLFFFQKEGKQYKLLGIIDNIKWSDITSYYLPAIAQIREIDKINNLGLNFFLRCY